MQKNMISGSIYDAAVAATDTKALAGRMPRVGATVEFDDGRKFVFCSTDVDLAAGQVVAMQTALATPIDNGCAAASAGQNEVVLTITAVNLFGAGNGVLAAGRLAGGYLITNDDAGEGYTYRIKDNTAAATSGGVVTTRITLYDNLKVALTTSSDIFILGPRYGHVVVGTAALPPVGIAVVPTTASTAGVTQYFWVQVAGIAGVVVKTGTNIAIGKVACADADGGVRLGTLSGNAEDMQIPVGIFAGTETTATGKVPVQLTIGG